MKNSFSKIILLLLVLAFQIFAQEKPKALKFDEFVVEPYKYSETEKHFEKFAAQLKKTPQMSAVIIRYSPRKQTYSKSGYWNAENYLLVAQRMLEAYNIPDSRIIKIDGGIRAEETLEFWIVPKETELPKPNPQFQKSDVVFCPTSVSINGNGFTFERNTVVDFSARIYEENPSEKLTYEWETSEGRIIKGQGTASIKVDISHAKKDLVIIKMNVKGLALECENQSVTTLAIIGKNPYQFDSAARYNFSDLSARLYAFMMALKDNPTTKGYIIIYASRAAGVREMERAISSVKRAFAFMRWDLSQITIVRGGFREYNTVDTWLLPDGVEPPKPTPTVDEKFIVFNKSKKKKSPKSK